MPLYDVEHVIPLTEEQQETLAKAFTDAHATRFKTPKFFINVRYTDARGQAVFRGGRRAVYNRLILRTRAGDQELRSKQLYDDHCRELVRVWERVVGKEAERALRTVWVLGALTTAVECGIARPRVGEEEQWLASNMVEFRRLAAAGDEDFVELVHELDSATHR
ncbi:hypothetical protein PV04_00366 [Phialophora macrospora]|uniref:Tautomerase cis-CaaD-like domain-containing protein n=1 Tax=Phialophora macrospora TaxID=1851006 RepID=A0A0D2ECY9_9EURO|nr:hypothetical protein PV04_00366 [Phialophora macrospora]